MVTMRAVLELPPRESESRRVSLESRKGTCWLDLCSVSAWMQLPNAANEKLIFLASSSLEVET